MRPRKVVEQDALSRGGANWLQMVLLEVLLDVRDLLARDARRDGRREKGKQAAPTEG